MSITWNTGSAAARFRHNLKLKLKNKKHQATSIKLQAASITKKTHLNDIG